MSNPQNINSKKRDANDVLREDGEDELRRQFDVNRTVVPFRAASRPLERADQELPDVNEIIDDMRKSAPATRGDAIAVWRMEQARRAIGEWPKWHGEENWEEWVFSWDELPELAIEHMHGHEVDEILKDLQTVKPNATRNDAIEKWVVSTP
jgi:hypothetical protein